jgi:hypothetical protein
MGSVSDARQEKKKHQTPLSYRTCCIGAWLCIVKFRERYRGYWGGWNAKHAAPKRTPPILESGRGLVSKILSRDVEAASFYYVRGVSNSQMIGWYQRGTEHKMNQGEFRGLGNKLSENDHTQFGSGAWREEISRRLVHTTGKTPCFPISIVLHFLCG